MDNAIKLYKGEENGVVVETSDWGNSIFSDQYQQALNVVRDMLEENRRRIEKDDQSMMTPNIVSFCGDRGEGKTSCMESVVHILKSMDYKGKLEYIDTIDPAYFDHNHNVIELILGLMYTRFNDYHNGLEPEKKAETGYVESRQNLAKYFQNARGCLRNMYEGRDRMFDASEQLSIMMTGMSLHQKLSMLFKEYLRFFTKYENEKDAEGKTIEKAAIIIRIDDTDLNMKGAYRMLELIRTYLNNPYCIILMSCNMDQLRKVVEDGLARQIQNQDNYELPAMALRYIIKVIPISRQIHMPKVYDLANRRLELYKSRESTEKVEYKSIKNAVVKMIFFKTRFLFFNSKGSVNPIIPNNLRSFRHLVGLLSEMKNFTSREVSQMNMRRFVNYFYTTWTEQLNEDYKEIADELISVQDIIMLNKIAVTRLQGIVKEEQIVELSSQNVFNPNVASYNVSAGDVFAILDVIDRTSIDNQLRLLSFFIRSFYSMKIFELYDEVSDDVLQKNVEDNENKGELYRADEMFQNANRLQQFVNGSLFTYQPNELLPYIANNGNQPRDCKVLDGTAINKLVGEVRDGMKVFDNPKRKKEISDFKHKFRMLEFYCLTIRRSLLSSKLQNYTGKDTGLELPAHLMSFTSSNNHYLFDVLMPFVSIINVEATYNRFSQIPTGELYNFAISHEWSLLRQMMQEVYNKEIAEGVWDEDFVLDGFEHDYEYPRKRLLSNMVIRNGEVLSAVYEGIKSRRFKSYKDSKNTTILSTFYEDIINSKMHTYPRGEDEIAYTIQFSALKAIATFISCCPENFFNTYFLVAGKKRSNKASARDKKQEIINTQWARDRYFKLNLDEDEKITSEELTNRFSEHYAADYDILRGLNWDKTFKKNTLYLGTTIFKKLGAMKETIDYVNSQD